MLILKGLFSALFQIAMIGTFLLVPAGAVAGGTWWWHRGLIFIGAYSGMLFTSVFVLAACAPKSLEARLLPLVSPTQPAADKLITLVFVATFFIWLAFIPLDVFSFEIFPPPPSAVSLFGGLLFVTGYAILLGAIYQNSFAIPIVDDQRGRGQTVISTGLYSIVRHPFYGGLLLYLFGLPLWLESLAACVASLLFLMILAARIVIEEKQLQQVFPGYADYVNKVRYRLVPFIW